MKEKNEEYIFSELQMNKKMNKSSTGHIFALAFFSPVTQPGLMAALNFLL